MHASIITTLSKYRIKRLAFFNHVNLNKYPVYLFMIALF